jgi:NAD(P)-dependent dehydrogenase (short-subunit alcohol dehydrogenase family)
MSESGDRKTIFITGAASGIGRATAQTFAERGWYVGLYDVNQQGLVTVAGEIGEDNCCLQLLEVRDMNSWQSAVAHFAGHTGGRMDMFFNNAGILRVGRFEDVRLEHAEALIDINVKGVIKGIYATLELLKQTAKNHGKARILNTASLAGLYGVPSQAVYSASKFAVRSLTESLSIEFARYNIDVADLMPSFIETPMVVDAVEGTNRAVKEMYADPGDIAPVSLVAEEAWAAANETVLHRPVGKPARRVKRIVGLFPGYVRKLYGSFYDTFDGQP